MSSPRCLVGMLAAALLVGACGGQKTGGNQGAAALATIGADGGGAGLDAAAGVDVPAMPDAGIDAAGFGFKPGAERSACDPCEASAQCRDPGSVCAAMGVPVGAAGNFCQLPCDPEHPCAPGSYCTGTSTVEGGFVSACRPLSNFCGCSAKAAARDWTTPCFATLFSADGALVGRCEGTWSCGEQGASCSAAEPAPESCDGLDNDCDGQTDEEAPCEDGDPCTVGESCQGGACNKGSDTCECRTDGDCKSEDRCTARPRCDRSALPWRCRTRPLHIACKQDEAGPCTVLACDPKSGACVARAGKEGQGCDADGDPCTESDRCTAGKCVPGPERSCEDGNPCTFDRCTAPGGEAGCEHLKKKGACDDGDACTASSACQAGACVGAGVKLCDDGDPCTVDRCDPATGACTAKAGADGATCEDGEPCTGPGRCKAGQCAGGAARACDDDNPCTDDNCAPGTGCTHAPNHLPCDDGNPCTHADRCADGACTAGPNLCGCQVNADCAAQHQDNPCPGELVCNATVTPHRCVVVSGTAITCSDDGNPCTRVLCSPAANGGKGGCVAQPRAEASPCDDGKPCTTAGRCKDRHCLADPVHCEDGNPCTKDSCGPAGCRHPPTSGGCDDGNACTIADRCAAGRCAPGAPKGCDDGNFCTSDGCDPATGNCLHDAAGHDELVCKTGLGACGPSTCSAGVCKPVSAAPCDDAEPCTDDACVAGKGCEHKANTAPCDDGNVCTVADACAAGSCKPGTARVCDDGNTCTADACSPVADSADGCVGTPAKGASCDDGDKCTVGDHCEASHCAATPKDCGDDEECTLDTCKAGVCSHDLHSKDGRACKVHKWCWGHGTCSGGLCAGKPGTCPDPKWQEQWPVQYRNKLRPATTLFDPVGYHVVRLTIDEKVWAAYLDQVLHAKHSHTYRAALEVDFDGVKYGKTGIRPFGFGSLFYNPQKPNIRMKFNYFDDKRTGPYKRRNLRLKASGQDRTWLRQPLNQSVVQQAGGHTPRWSWARVFINGEAFGLYQLFEQVDKRFFAANFGNKGGNDYEPSPICRGLNCPASGCEALAKYYKKDPGDAHEIVALAKLGKYGKTATWADEAAKLVDWDALLAQYAVEALISDFDSLAAAGNNTEIYVDETSGRMHFIPAGMDLTLGRSGTWYDLYAPWGWPNRWCKGRKDEFYLRILATPKLRGKLDALFAKLHCGAFSGATLLTFVTRMRAMIYAELLADPKGVATKAVIDKEYVRLIDYITKRDAYLNGKFGACK